MVITAAAQEKVRRNPSGDCLCLAGGESSLKSKLQLVMKISAGTDFEKDETRQS